MAGSILHPDSWEFELMGHLAKYEAAIDANFGEGYTARHPELVAACIQHAALGDLTTLSAMLLAPSTRASG
jgi:hypothetical protein